ncbi:MAG: hypothetical protein QOE05_3067 [Actinomycetota bacterium]|jgi:hypothetical protein|nr:hypothetical protein [Actinomycetota bacterium]
MIGQRLRDLDNRVLGADRRTALLRTEAGWRKAAGRWKLLAAVAIAELALVAVFEAFFDGPLPGMLFVGGYLAFQAGMLKAEDDRLHGRGMYRYLPPGL